MEWTRRPRRISADSPAGDSSGGTVVPWYCRSRERLHWECAPEPAKACNCLFSARLLRFWAFISERTCYVPWCTSEHAGTLTLPPYIHCFKSLPTQKKKCQSKFARIRLAPNPISALSCVKSKVATGELQRTEKYQNRERSFCRQSLRYPGHSASRMSVHELYCFTRNPSVSNVVTTLIGDNAFLSCQFCGR